MQPTTWDRCGVCPTLLFQQGLDGISSALHPLQVKNQWSLHTGFQHCFNQYHIISSSHHAFWWNLTVTLQSYWTIAAVLLDHPCGPTGPSLRSYWTIPAALLDHRCGPTGPSLRSYWTIPAVLLDHLITWHNLAWKVMNDFELDIHLKASHSAPFPRKISRDFTLVTLSAKMVSWMVFCHFSKPGIPPHTHTLQSPVSAYDCPLVNIKGSDVTWQVDHLPKGQSWLLPSFSCFLMNCSMEFPDCTLFVVWSALLEHLVSRLLYLCSLSLSH